MAVKMKISIITVVFNGDIFLEKTIQSVLNQTYKNLEYIIIDGGSSDGTIDIIKKYEDKISHWVSEKDCGIYDAMNKGINIANGEFINFLNSGDYFYSNDVLESIFERDCSGYNLIYGSAVVVNENRTAKVLLKPKKFTKLNLLFWTTRVVCHQSLFVHKNIITPYSDAYKLKGELYWYFDLVKRCKKYLIINDPIVFYSLGGAGDINYKLNTREAINVVFAQAGMLGILSLPIVIYKYLRKVFK
jgi:glycosyltransferase involved in cell wall biosynthesis